MDRRWPGELSEDIRNSRFCFMTGALPENDEQAVEMTRKRRLQRKPFSLQQLVEFDAGTEGAGDRH
jgi:hypothetical protein